VGAAATALQAVAASVTEATTNASLLRDPVCPKVEISTSTSRALLA
jgi:hypothetical protein